MQIEVFATLMISVSHVSNQREIPTFVWKQSRRVCFWLRKSWPACFLGKNCKQSQYKMLQALYCRWRRNAYMHILACPCSITCVCTLYMIFICTLYTHLYLYPGLTAELDAQIHRCVLPISFLVPHIICCKWGVIRRVKTTDIKKNK